MGNFENALCKAAFFRYTVPKRTSALLFLKNLANILSRDKEGLILSEAGLLFKGTPLGRKIGLVEWKDIELLSGAKVYKSDFIFLKLKKPEKYAAAIRPRGVRESFMRHGFGITNDEINIDFDEMEDLIRGYFDKYK